MPNQSFEELCELFAYQPKGRPLDSEEAADVLRIHPGTMAQYRLRGEGPRFFSPPGTRRVWYAEKDLLAWISDQERGELRRLVVASLTEVMLDCGNRAVRADAYDVLFDMKVIQP